LKPVRLHNTGNFQRSAQKIDGRQFPYKAGTKGQFGRSNRAGQWGSSDKYLMGLANAVLQQTDIP
jgi:hypothetical protein